MDPLGRHKSMREDMKLRYWGNAWHDERSMFKGQDEIPFRCCENEIRQQHKMAWGIG